MKQIGMLFKGEMVRALLRDQNPKSQTRRLKFDGKVGDVIWVKETFVPNAFYPTQAYFRADMSFWDIAENKRLGLDCGDVGISKWKPSIFMPRALSRINLEVTALRQERLQDISEADAIAEGIYDFHSQSPGMEAVPYYKSLYPPCELYRMLWTMIHGKASWDANPLVYVVTFKRIKPCCRRDHDFDGNCDVHREPIAELRKELLS